MAGDMWKYAVITTKGLLLQSKVATGGTIEFTKTKTGAGMVEPVLLQAQTALTDERQEFSFAAESTVNKETGTVSLVAVIDNDGLQVGYDCYQVGIYATDPDDGEILYAILQSENALAVPAEADMVGWIAEMNMAMQYGNAENVQITMNPAGVISREEYEQHLNNENNPHKVTIEQVCSASGGKLPVQNGGLYINSETTEENKAEAQEALVTLGSVPIIDARSADYDMDKIFTNYQEFKFYRANNETLGTPYRYGKTGKQGMVIMNMTTHQNNYGVQIAFVTGEIPLMRTLDNGVISEWTTGFIPLDGSVPMSGKWLELYLNYAYVFANENQIQIGARTTQTSGKTDDNTRFLALRNSNYVGSLKNALALTSVVNGVKSDYNIYGEHNVTKGTTDLTAGSSALGNSCIHLVYE